MKPGLYEYKPTGTILYVGVDGQIMNSPNDYGGFNEIDMHYCLTNRVKWREKIYERVADVDDGDLRPPSTIIREYQNKAYEHATIAAIDTPAYSFR